MLGMRTKLRSTFFRSELLSYTAVMLNILTIYAMRKTTSLPKRLKTLLPRLAVSDLGVGLLVQPLYIARVVNLAYSTNIKLNFVHVVFYIAPFFTLLAMSVDRFLPITPGPRSSLPT